MNRENFFLSPGKKRLPEGSDGLGEKVNSESQEDAINIGHGCQKATDESENDSHQGCVQEKAQKGRARRPGRTDPEAPDRNIRPPEKE